MEYLRNVNRKLMKNVKKKSELQEEQRQKILKTKEKRNT